MRHDFSTAASRPMSFEALVSRWSRLSLSDLEAGSLRGRSGVGARQKFLAAPLHSIPCGSDFWANQLFAPSHPASHCSVCSAAGFARRARVEPSMNRTTYTNLWNQRSKCAPTVLLDTGRTGEDSAAVGWPTTRRASARIKTPACVSDSAVRVFEVKPAIRFPISIARRI